MLNFKLFIGLMTILLFSCATEKCIENSMQCNCPENLNPVCGCNDITYNTPCEANCKGIEYTMGKCK